MLSQKDFGNEMFGYARDFKQADQIIITAPYWDLSFPSLLKVYIENIMVTGLTFGYEGFHPVGYCKANELFYFTTAGGYINDQNLGADYIKNITAILGIPNFRFYAIEGLDIDPLKREELVKEGIKDILNQIYEESKL